MANVVIRKERPAVPARVDWDPYGVMREMLNWDPFAEMIPAARSEKFIFNPAFEVKETKEGYVFKADLPGVKEADVEITLTGNRLTISGKRESETQSRDDTYFTYERAYGMFTRAFTLPEGADAEHIRAELKEGVLTLQLPKLPELQPKKIALSPEKGHA